MKRKCICDLCSCGRHHCPHLPTKIYDKTEKPCLFSEYTKNYPLYRSYLPRESFKPKLEYQKASAPMEGLTTFRSQVTLAEQNTSSFSFPQDGPGNVLCLECGLEA
ncbi:stabilizer of axonemal microtubules 1-like [Pseudorca crassidens]|uniref:stabilizer of axonemal microtubules 1-like n=1 Tax=Pseudorca crassidens TaxID=82174 RepID=UPI00352D5E74